MKTQFYVIFVFFSRNFSGKIARNVKLKKNVGLTSKVEKTGFDSNFCHFRASYTKSDMSENFPQFSDQKFFSDMTDFV